MPWQVGRHAAGEMLQLEMEGVGAGTGARAVEENELRH